MNFDHGRLSLCLYAFSHFCVDFSCFFLLTGSVRTSFSDLSELSAAFLLYNVLAFGLQPLFGFVSDRYPSFPVSSSGCLLIFLALLPEFHVPLSLILCALGNAGFHTGGGIDSLKNAAGNMARSGIFVSTGALGVVFGTLAGETQEASRVLPLLLMTACAALLRFCEKREKRISPAPASSFHITSGRSASILLPLVLFSITIRACAGGLIPAVLKPEHSFILAGAATFAGKAAGGILADRFGPGRTAVTALLLSIPLFLIGQGAVLPFFLATMLFNVTMPVTLCAVASELPGCNGLAFGLTTLALLWGSLPGFYIAFPEDAKFPIFVALVLLSAAFLCFTIKSKKGTPSHEKKEQRI